MCCDVIKGTQCSTLSAIAVNNEQCVRGATNTVLWQKQHTALSEQTQNTRRRLPCYVRARRAARALHDSRQSKREEKKKDEDERKRKRRVVLDGGGARLADAATRHHLTQTTHGKKRKSGEQNKHQRTQAIQKTSTRSGTSHGHHTLPSMRSQTPIHKQRTTQTQLS
nr:MAG TPA: hypothetical protein [Caudoviricetes sp.]